MYFFKAMWATLRVQTIDWMDHGMYCAYICHLQKCIVRIGLQISLRVPAKHIAEFTISPSICNSRSQMKPVLGWVELVSKWNPISHLVFLSVICQYSNQTSNVQLWTWLHSSPLNGYLGIRCLSHFRTAAPSEASQFLIVLQKRGWRRAEIHSFFPSSVSRNKKWDGTSCFDSCCDDN